MIQKTRAAGILPASNAILYFIPAVPHGFFELSG
jgi:hypothetical protein